MSIPDASHEDLERALASLRESLGDVSFHLDVPSAEHAVDAVADAVNQLDDYILPRLANLDAPLLAVVGGSTGSGKSTLVNSLLGQNVARATAIRPTTRRPLLVHAPGDAQWFGQTRILPGLARVYGDVAEAEPTRELAVAQSSALPSGLALLDSPDIDSVVEDNRRLAAQLMSAADLWLFVTSAARYADAIPWAMLADARERNVVVAVVLNRVPQGVGAEVRADLARRLEDNGLGHAPLFVISERIGDEGRIPADAVAPVRTWLQGLVRDAVARSSVARQTLMGAVDSLVRNRQDILLALRDQVETVGNMRGDVDRAGREAYGSIVASLADGKILRSEVLQRWNEVVGTGTWMRRLEGGVSRARDRITGWFKGRPAPVSVEGLEEGIEVSLRDALVAEAEGALRSVDEAWCGRPGTQGPRSGAAAKVRSDEERLERAGRLVHSWQRSLAAMVTEQGKDKRAMARAVSVGVNVVGAALMIVVFASSSGLTGGEVAVAGGTAVVAQRLLEAIFGDDAVRAMARKARESLLERAEAFIAEDLAPYVAECEAVAVDRDVPEALARAFDSVERRGGRSR
ncbi:MAG: dynamin family protein [Actinomycetaceae bacterium]|nr:dynamin family protein [Actinomycetaceae bacterium]